MLRKTRALALEGSGEGRGRTQDAVPAAELLAMRRWLLGGAGDTGVMGPVCNPSAYHPREPCRVVLHEPLAPRRPYLPMGTLRRAVTYPDAAESRSVEQIAKVLEKVELDHLVARLDEDGPRDQTLSAGEAAAGVRARPASSPGYHRARRSYRGTRCAEPGSRDGGVVAGAQTRDGREHRSPCGTGGLSPPQNHTPAWPGRRKARQRCQPRPHRTAPRPRSARFLDRYAGGCRIGSDASAGMTDRLHLSARGATIRGLPMERSSCSCLAAPKYATRARCATGAAARVVWSQDRSSGATAGMDAEASRSQLAAALVRVAAGDRAALRMVYQNTSAKLFGVC